MGADAAQAGKTKVTIQVRKKGKKTWSKLRALTTTVRGVYGLTREAPQAASSTASVDVAERPAPHRPADRVVLSRDVRPT